MGLRRLGTACAFVSHTRNLRFKAARKVQSGTATARDGTENVERGGGGDWLKHATTYSDVQTASVDPWPSGPYSTKDIERVLKTSEKKKFREAEVVYETEKKAVRKKKVGLNFDHIAVIDQRVLLFPGQGAQFVGMGAKLFDCPASDALFLCANDVLGYDLKKLCLEGPKQVLDGTVYCQPAIFVTALAALEKYKHDHPTVFECASAAAGFSIGELCALVAADVLSFQDALKLVKVRAEQMQRCSAEHKSGMISVRISASSRLGEAMKDARDHTSEQLKRRGMPEAHGVCEIANYLFQGMRVLGGHEEAIRFIDEHSGDYDIKVLKRLPVSGGFHTKLMADASCPFSEAVHACAFNLPKLNVYSNVSGELYDVATANSIKKNLIMQLTSPVKWEQIQHNLLRMSKGNEFPHYIEFGPGRQLSAMFLQISKKAHKKFISVPV